MVVMIMQYHQTIQIYLEQIQEVYEQLAQGETETVQARVALQEVHTTISTVNKAGNTVFRPKAELDQETGQAAGDVARMMDEISKSEGYNRMNVDPSSQQGANAILEASRSRVMADIDQNMRVLKKEILKNADAETEAKFKSIEKDITISLFGTFAL